MTTSILLPIVPRVESNTVGAGIGQGVTSPSGGQLGLTAPAGGLCLPRAPRNAVIRSRVIMRRTAEGVRWALPPDELLQVNDLSVSSVQGAGGTAASLCVRRTCQIGEGPLKVPIELVMAPPSPIGGSRKKTPRSRSFADASDTLDRVATQGADATLMAVSPPSARAANGGLSSEAVVAPARAATGRIRRHFPEMTRELQTEMRDRLLTLQSSCRVADFKGNARAIRFFLKELGDTCALLDIPISEKSYRAKHNYSMLTSFVRFMPAAVGAELPPSGELPTSGFLAFALGAACVDFEWTFTYNTFTHRLCDCHKAFSGIAKGDCLLPADGGNPAPGSRLPKATGIAADVASGLNSTVSVDKKLEIMRRKERHITSRLPDLGAVLRKRFDEFAGTALPSLSQDFLGLPSNKKQLAASRGWERFVAHFESEVAMFDSCYTQFEHLFLDMASKTIGSALDPVSVMTGASSFLVRAPTDAFTEMQTATLCQRLGLLKRRVDFGSDFKLVTFDPGLLTKARRIKELDTYKEVIDMAAALLTKFDAFCQVLVDLRGDQIQPELSENAELRTTVLELEEVWSECHFVLQQDCLDFIGSLLEFIPQLSAQCRWQLWLGMQDDLEEIRLTGDLNQQQEQQKQLQLHREQAAEARTMLFETLPLLMYMSEVWQEVCLDILTLRFASVDYNKVDRKVFEEELLDQFRSRGVSDKALAQLDVRLRDVGVVFAAVKGPQEALQELRQKIGKRSVEVMGSSGLVIVTPPSEHFRNLFCVKDDRHHTLRRDFEKFDEQRFTRLQSFVLGGLGSDGMNDAFMVRYFKNIQRQLKQVASFPTDQVPSAVVRAATSAEAGKSPQDLNHGHSPLPDEDQLRTFKCLHSRARWICALRVAQKVQPELFPRESPNALQRVPSQHLRQHRQHGSERREATSPILHS